jgi:ribosome biogenesis GTPase / thiamine phosphate phosphatase
LSKFQRISGTQLLGTEGESMLSLLEGLITDGSRGMYRVETDAGDYTCTIRGRLRKELTYAESRSAGRSVRDVKVKPHDPVAVGDRVRILPTGGAFTRKDPDPKLGELTTIAGLDQMIFVFATREPEPHLGLLDRFLVVGEAQHTAAVICVTKVDLGIADDLAERLAIYRAMGYPIVYTSIATGAGIPELRHTLAGHTSALLGKSGVGKSSLLNAVEPGLGQRVSAVSESTGKGRHTTTGTRLVRLSGPDGGYIADTAGIRALGLTRETLGNLDWCFREFRPYLGACHLSSCTHLHEADCAVREAVDAGALDAARYESYSRMREEG